MDEWGRLKALFPREVVARLRWNTRSDGNALPVARLFDPAGPSEILLLRSRLNGHGVDVLHNLTEGGPMLQSIWIADIMRLNPLLGIKLLRDEAFKLTTPISGYPLGTHNVPISKGTHT